jgi:hypothetical protein
MGRGMNKSLLFLLFFTSGISAMDNRYIFPKIARSTLLLTWTGMHVELSARYKKNILKIVCYPARKNMELIQALDLTYQTPAGYYGKKTETKVTELGKTCINMFYTFLDHNGIKTIASPLKQDHEIPSGFDPQISTKAVVGRQRSVFYSNNTSKYRGPNDTKEAFIQAHRTILIGLKELAELKNT